jgi:hypothetical protein
VLKNGLTARFVQTISCASGRMASGNSSPQLPMTIACFAFRCASRAERLIAPP